MLSIVRVVRMREMQLGSIYYGLNRSVLLVIAQLLRAERRGCWLLGRATELLSHS